MLLDGVLLLGGQGEQGRPGREVKGKLQHGLVKSSAFHTPETAALCPYLANVRNETVHLVLSLGSPCSPAVNVPLRSARDPGKWKTQAAPHARTAAGLEEGVEEEEGEDTRVSRHCLKAPLSVCTVG